MAIGLEWKDLQYKTGTLLLLTRVIIKILTHPWYPSSFDWFSWGWSKKIFFEKKLKWRLKKGKTSLKTQKMHSLPVFKLTLASLTAIWVEQNQCPSHQSILLTQGPIHEIFMKKYWELAELENEVFLRWPFWIF